VSEQAETAVARTPNRTRNLKFFIRYSSKSGRWYHLRIVFVNYLMEANLGIPGSPPPREFGGAIN
jgi:hypothetical protein